MSFYPTSYTVEHFHDDDGTLLAGGSLEFYIAGTTTPTPAYTDAGGTEAGTTITLNSRGEPAVSGNAVIIWLSSNVNYKIVLKDASGNTKTTPDNLTSGINSDAANASIAAADFGQWPSISVNADDTAHDIDFNSGVIADSSGASLLILSGAMTKRLDAAWAAGNDAGGLFSGAVANNTTYYCFIVESNADQSIDCGFDTDIDAANIPGGYTNYRRIASFSTDGSANIDSTTVTHLLNAEIAKRGENNGTAQLDGSGRLPESQLPATVDSNISNLQSQITSNDGDIAALQSGKQDKLSELSKTSIFSGSDVVITNSDITGSWAVGKYAFKISDFPTRIFYFDIPDIGGTDTIAGVAYTRTNAGSLDTYTWIFNPSPPSFQCNIYSRTSSGVSGTLASITNVYLID